MTASFKIDAEHPWPWLDAFPEYAERFFNGREDEKAALFRCVLSAPVTVLFGKSGLGKSSLLQAGLFPQLRSERLLPIYMRLLHDQNAPELCAQLAKRFSEEIHKTQSPGAASPPLHYRYRQSREDEDAEPIILTDDLWADLHRNDIELVDAAGKRWQPVFVLDQFEEIFTLGGQNPDRQTHCFYQLGDLLENRIPKALAERLNQDDELFDQLNPDSQPYRFLLSLREDYLPDLEEWSELIPRLSPNRFRLLPMTAPQAIAAVQKTGGELVTPQDAENIVEYLSANQTAGQQKRRGVTQIEPALLGLMCAGLNEDRLRSQTKQLKTDNLTKEGGLIVERFYDQAFAGLPESVRNFVEQHLITNDGVRLAYPVRSMETEKLATAGQLNTLVDKRLLRRESLEEGDRIELVHDRLAQVALRRRQESAQRREVQIQQKKRLRWLVGFAGLLLLITIFATYMWQSERKAKQAWMEATATRLAIEGNSIIDGSRQGSTLAGLLKVLAGHRLARATNGGEALLDEVLQRMYLKLKPLVYLRESEFSISSLAISPNGKRFVTGSLNKTLRMWDAEIGQPIGQQLSGHPFSVFSVAFSPNGKRVVSGSADDTLQIWDADTGQPIGKPLTGHSDSVLSVKFSPDGKRIISGSMDETLRLWDTETQQPIGQPMTGHSREITSVAFSPDGKRIVSASADHSLVLWDADGGRPIGNPLTGHSDRVLSVDFSPDGKRIISGSADHTLQLWSATTGQSIGQPMAVHSGEVTSVAFSPDGKHIVSGSADNTVQIWDAENGQPIGKSLTAHSGEVTSVVFRSDGKFIISISKDKTLQFWNTTYDQPTDNLFTDHSNGKTNAVFSPDGKLILSSNWNNSLLLLNAENGQPIGNPLAIHSGSIYNIAISPDGQHIASASSDNNIRLWDLKSRLPIGEPLTGHPKRITYIAFSPNGARIASGSADKTVRQWDAITGQPIGKPLVGHSERVSSVAFSPDGQRIVSGSWDKTLRLWDVETGQPIGRPLVGHSREVTSVKFSPDGKLVVSGSEDNSIRLWNTDNGQLTGKPLTGHSDAIMSVDFSPDGKRIVSGSADNSLWLWDTDSGNAIGKSLTGHSAKVISVAFSPDGKRIVSSSADKSLRIWPVFEAWADGLCKKLDRNMSYKEWRDWVSPDIAYIEQCPGLPIPPDQADEPVKEPAQAITE